MKQIYKRIEIPNDIKMLDELKRNKQSQKHTNQTWVNNFSWLKKKAIDDHYKVN